MAILIKALFMIGAVVNYGIDYRWYKNSASCRSIIYDYGGCACDHPEGTLDFPVVIQMNILLVPVHVC